VPRERDLALRQLADDRPQTLRGNDRGARTLDLDALARGDVQLHPDLEVGGEERQRRRGRDDLDALVDRVHSLAGDDSADRLDGVHELFAVAAKSHWSVSAAVSVTVFVLD